MMRGRVSKRGTSWSVRYDEGHRRRPAPPALQRRLRHPPRSAGFLTDQLARLGDGSYATPSKLTVGGS